jgi:hypothetical protein
MRKRITPDLMGTILDAGYNIDYIDAATIDKLGAIPYPILVIPPTDRIPLSTYEKIAAYAAAGKVIAIGKLPALAPGLMQQGESPQVAALSGKLFRADGHRGVFIDSVSQLADALHQALLPDVDAAGHIDGLGFIHRKLAAGDIYYLVNTGNQAIDGMVTFRSGRSFVAAWDPDSGQVLFSASNGRDARVPLKLAPYESRIFVLTDHGETAPASADAAEQPHEKEIADLDSGWQIHFARASSSQPLSSLESWTQMPARQYYSGEADYTRSITIDHASANGSRIVLDFGVGTPTTDNRPVYANGLHALLDPPIREAAIVYVNGARAGSLWHPPYRIDISRFVHAGENQIEVRVYNTAINTLAGQPPHDYSALYAKYGKRFEPQDMENLQPIPSGLFGPIRLLQLSPE